jgi:hypothetical protein
VWPEGLGKKAISVTGQRIKGLSDVEDPTLFRQLTDGGKVVSPTHWPCSTPQKHFSASGIHFCYSSTVQSDQSL